jgi:hypothetical protein
VSERPKEHASKACEGSRPPWVQIPPPPPNVGGISAGQRFVRTLTYDSDGDCMSRFTCLYILIRVQLTKSQAFL